MVDRTAQLCYVIRLQNVHVTVPIRYADLRSGSIFNRPFLMEVRDTAERLVRHKNPIEGACTRRHCV